MKIIQTTLNELTPEQKEQLRKLTLTVESSLMKKTLDHFGTHPGEERSKVKIAIVSNELDKWIAWALVRPWYHSQQLVMIYVLPSHRRQGIGKSLIKHLREQEEFDCYPWDDGSTLFFEAVRLRPYWRA